MRTKLFKTLLASFFLLLFVGGKAFGYHILLHDHDTKIVECEVCEKALVDQFSPFEGANDPIEIDKTPEEFFFIIDVYTSKIYTPEQSHALFSRPPPSLN